MRRPVLIWVDDERTDFLAIYERRGDPMPGEQSELLRSFDVPVPQDDQVARDLDDLTMWAWPKNARNEPQEPPSFNVIQAVQRLRAWAGLD